MALPFYRWSFVRGRKLPSKRKNNYWPVPSSWLLQLRKGVEGGQEGWKTSAKLSISNALTAFSYSSWPGRNKKETVMSSVQRYYDFRLGRGFSDFFYNGMCFPVDVKDACKNSFAWWSWAQSRALLCAVGHEQKWTKQTLGKCLNASVAAPTPVSDTILSHQPPLTRIHEKAK